MRLTPAEKSGETPQARGGSTPSPQESKRLQRKGTIPFTFITPQNLLITTVK
ncbi:hypothetical protein [Rossellomorea marisflavi]|uniref:hypothetical protein n=1 Tax=Rossellomorea marisflavi TaxID=189381 RepID=UPI0013649AFB|nr:hypothetical protein [Rossellomorea marisflavi]